MTETSGKKTLKIQIKERVQGERRYNPHGAERTESLAGVKLASFKQRFWAYMIDLVILGITMSMFSGVLMLGYISIFHPKDPIWNLSGVHVNPDARNKAAAHAPKTGTATDTEDDDEAVHSSNGPLLIHVDADKKESLKEASEGLDLIFSVLYFGLIVWGTNGLTVGKKLMKIRIVSLTHDRITLWQSCERALGYGASALELGFGFFQFFIYPNRTCVHDRIAETIVIAEPPQEKKAALQEAETVEAVARLEAEEARAVDAEVLKKEEKDLAKLEGK